MLNKVTLIGNLTRDVEVKEFQDGGKVAQFGIATNERGYTTKDGREIPATVEYHNIVMKGKFAEVAAKYLRKGSKVYLEGKLKTRNYDNTQGQKVYITEIHAGSMIMLGGKEDAAGSFENSPVKDNFKQVAPNSADQGYFGADEDDDLPF
jgi:single-strand DNA-binding protein